MRIRNNLIDIAYWFFGLTSCLMGSMIFSPERAFAFTKLRNGFEMVTTTYLIPLSLAVAGASLVSNVILSYFKNAEFQKNIGNVFFLSVICFGGLELLKIISQTLA